ncbi:MAG: dockerin type I domain-containing protein, partial [Rubripirellula sp.]
SGAGGGIFLRSPNESTLQIEHSIIAANSDDGTSPDFSGDELSSDAFHVAHSLIGDNVGTGLPESQSADPSTGNLVGSSIGVGVTDPLLDALSDNGGGSPTHDPTDASPVIDAGDAAFDANSFQPSLDFDQRGAGFDRVRGIADMGAIEAIPALQLLWADPEDISFGTALSSQQLNAVANVPGQWVYLPTFGMVLDAGPSQTLSATFTPQDLTNYVETQISVVINVLTAEPVVTWNDPDPMVFGTPLSGEQLNAVANVAGTFAYTPPEGVLLTAGIDREIFVTFTPESPNYDTITQSVLIDVLKATPDVTWPDPSPIVVGTALDETQLNATASMSGTFVYSPDLGTILDVGDDQILTATFTPSDTANFNIVVSQVTIDVVAKQDFGDAPANYPVLAAEDGARHLSGGPTLGSTIDIDDDGQPSADANGDGIDDDGVRAIASVIALPNSQTVSSFEVTVSDESRLDAWIDFNADGDWDDAGEQIFSSQGLAAGSQRLSYSVPAGATPGETAARFRLSSAGGLAPTRPAADGEVEDYLISILDGELLPQLDVNLRDGSLSAYADAGEFVVQSNGVELSRVSLATLGSIEIVGGASDQTFELDPSNGFDIPVNGIRIDGDTYGNTLVPTGNASSLDLTNPLVDITNFLTVDLSNDDASAVTIDSESVSQLSPLTNRLEIRKGNEDSVIFADVDEWRMGAPETSGGRFLVSALHQTNGELVVIDTETPWQNLLRIADVNNDGRVSSSDALRVINELSRRDYSDALTGQLHDPATIEIFPGVYFDHNGDGFVTALDALRVINDFSRFSGSGGEGEAVAFVHTDSSEKILDELPERETEVDVSQTKLVGATGASISEQPMPSTFDDEDDTPSEARNSAIDELLASASFIDTLRS